MKVDKKLLSGVLGVGALVTLAMMVTNPAGKGLEYWNYFNLAAVVVSLFAAYTLWSGKDAYGRSLGLANLVSGAAVALGHLNYFHLGMAQEYAAHHIWGPVDGFLLATWVLTALYLRK